MLNHLKSFPLLSSCCCNNWSRNFPQISFSINQHVLLFHPWLTFVFFRLYLNAQSEFRLSQDSLSFLFLFCFVLFQVGSPNDKSFGWSWNPMSSWNDHPTFSFFFNETIFWSWEFPFIRKSICLRFSFFIIMFQIFNRFGRTPEKNEKNDFQDERCLWPWNVWQFNVNLVSRLFSASPKSSFFVLRFRNKRETDQFSIPFSRVKRILDSGRLLIRMALNWIKIVFVFLILFFVFRDWSKCIHDWWGFKEWLLI